MMTGRCPTGKRKYASKELAEDALIEAHTVYEYAKGQGPVGVYLCEECGYFHLTSQGPLNERLAGQITAGKIRLQKEANRWMGKIRKR